MFQRINSYINNLPSNNNIISKNNYFYNTVSFSGKKRNYSSKHYRIQKKLKEAAVKYKLPGAYTGIPFSEKNAPTIEHIIPHSELEKNNLKDGPWNWVLVSDFSNQNKGDDNLKDYFNKNPARLLNFFLALREYKNINIQGFSAKRWADSLQNTVSTIMNNKPLQGIDIYV